MADRNSMAATSITDDLKVFFGRKNDILDIQKQSKVVNRKWYLAWDTGEFFIGGSTGKLYKFGGSNNDLSESDVKDIISQYTESDLNQIRSQLSIITKQYVGNSSAIESLRNDLNAEITNLETNTQAFIDTQVRAVLSSATDLTYSKKQIDEKLLTLKSAITDQIYSKAEVSDLIAKQATTTEDSIKAMTVWHKTGNDIQQMQAAGASNAYCLCTEDSTNGVFITGHIYYVNKMVVTDINSGSGGTSGAYVPPTITLTYQGSDHYVIQTGQSFATQASFAYSVSDTSLIKSDYLHLYQEGVVINSLVSVSGTSLSTLVSLTHLEPRKYYYYLTGTDKKDNQITGTFYLDVRSPLYYGSLSNQAIGDTSETDAQLDADRLAIKGLSSVLADTTQGKYTFQNVGDGQYLWFCVPSKLTLDVTRITLNGFSAKFNSSYSTISITFNGVTETYKCYRSMDPLQSVESVTLYVTE